MYKFTKIFTGFYVRKVSDLKTNREFLFRIWIRTGQKVPAPDPQHRLAQEETKKRRPEGGVDGLVNPLWVEDEADGEQHEHLVRLLVDLVVLVGLRLRGGHNR
jgi:hypothetical protein